MICVQIKKMTEGRGGELVFLGFSIFPTPVWALEKWGVAFKKRRAPV